MASSSWAQNGINPAATTLFDDCHRQVDEAPQEKASYLCYFLVALDYSRSEDPKIWRAAEQHLETLLASGQEVGLTSMVLGNLTMGPDDDRALQYFETAARELHRQGHAVDEVIARTNARKILFRQGKVQEADEQVRQVRLSAEGTDDSELLARYLTLSAIHRLDTGGDFGRAYIDLKQASTLNISENYRLQSRILFTLGRLAFDLGQWDDAIASYERQLQLIRDNGKEIRMAASALNLAMARQSKLELRPRFAALQELERSNRQALSIAEEEENQYIAAQSHRVIAEGLMSTHPAEALHHLETCLEIARQISNLNTESSCLSILGRLLLSTDPGAALQASSQALDLAKQRPDSLFDAFAWRSHLRTAWQALPRQQAIANSLQGLDAIEELRQAQQDPLTRAQLLSNWVADLSWLVGRLLEEANPDLPQAFAVIEQGRSRVLLEGMSTPDAVETTDENRQQVRRQIAAVQRLLLDPDLEATERSDLFDKLDRWELEERFSQPEAVKTPPSDIDLVELHEVENTLRPGEAMLSFQVDLEIDFYGQPAGGSWVLLITPNGSRRYSIADLLTLEPAVSIFLGLVERRDGSEAAIAEGLYEMILEDALADLPETVERLILIPDGTLHHLPFAALRSSKEEATLGERFEIVITPSATLWHRWRNEVIEPPQRSLLALADPDLPGDPRQPEATRNAVLLNGLRLGQLPHARREGKAVLRHLGGQLLIGADATERFIKAQDLGQFGVIHFASHAVSDAAHAERSSLVLTPGDIDEDGLLRAPEIADLNLEGRLVVLSACQTTAGELLKAEGILSLARAFFQARAHGVIGSRWPLRDDDAAFFFDRFYRHLAAGQSSAGAMRSARRDAIAEGLPAAAWSGVSLLGNGDTTVVPEMRPDTAKQWLWVASLAVLLLLITVSWRRSRAPVRKAK